MLKFKIVGCGAAGNKAVANLIKLGFPKESCFFVNSTKVDIPAECENPIIFGLTANRLGGCGKERSIGKQMLLEDMRTDASIIDNIVGIEDAIVLVGSTEGGSGSASIPILAKYFHEVYNKPVICCLFFGFKDDIRGLQNTIEICQEMSEEYTIIGIDNAAFLDESSGNRFKAEKSANDKFALIVKILMGATINYGEQVIDDTDLFKIVTTPGYLIADGKELPSRIKTAADYEKIIKDLVLAESKFIDPPKAAGAKRIGAIFNLTEIDDSIDYSASKIGEIYGNPYEYFISVGPSDRNEFYFIASGMKFPMERIQKIYDEYKSRSESMDKSKDSFFGNISQMRGNIDDSQFDMLSAKNPKPQVKANKSDFFGSFGISDFSDKGKKVTTGAIDPETKEDY